MLTLPSRSEFLWQGTPTRVRMGAGVASEVGAEFDGLGCRRVVLVTGARTGSSPLGRLVKEALGGRLAATFADVPQHSGVGTVDALAKLARSLDADGFMALGGGSASDTAKAAAILLAEGGRLEDHANVFIPPDHYQPKVLLKPKLPIVVLPTTASAAEVTPGLGIRADDGHKLVFWDHHVVPRVILLDPRAVMDVPVPVLATTGMNALAHCVEGLYSRVKNPISDALALHAMGLIARSLRSISDRPGDEQVRADLMTGAHLSGHVIANARVGLHHAICHGLGSHGGLPHGVANAVMLPHVMRFNRSAALAELAAMAAPLGAPPTDNQSEAADAAIKVVEDIQRACGVPRRLSEAGLDRARIPEIATMTLSDRGAYFNPIPAAPREEIVRLMEAAW